MNIVIINPIAASPAITPSGMLMPRVPSMAGDMQRLKEVNIVELGQAIADRGHEVTLILGEPYLGGKERDLGSGLRVVPVQTVMRFPFHPGLLPMTPELMGHPALQQADVIQTGEFHQLPTFFACVAAGESGIPLVLWQETFRPMRFPGSLYQRIYGTTLGRRVLTITKRFIPRTTQAKAYLEELGAEDGAIAPWIPTGVDLEAFAPGRGGFTPRDFGWAPETRLILIVGRLIHGKGVDIALRTLSRLSRKDPNVALLVAGGGPELANLQRLATELGISETVRFLGSLPRTDLIQLYNSVDLVLCTSRNDLLPFALIEASACARPCVTLDVGAVRDIVLDGATGTVVTEPRTEVLSQTIHALLMDDDLRLGFGREARKRMENLFSLTGVAGRLLEVYRGVGG